ncbi:DUF202 domain-containing protein [Paraliobacillus sediminis]|uniref:DUF202 domain-containing protein n=1 Tax=Paraliobacillus sediminis TaxID=1885916 RepID=UPI0013C33F98|nr:DUF202 domain-containing protein [Paraliobacillus sediminis]
MDRNNGALNDAPSVGDLLAMERTRLANDRTILAYIRTSLAFFATAAALIEFFDQNRKLEIIAYITIFFGVVILIFGFYSYCRSKKLIKNVMRNTES